MRRRKRANSEKSNESKQSADSNECGANSSANAAHDVFGGTPAFAEPMETHSAFGESSFDPEPLWGGGDDTPPHRDFEIQRALEGTDTTAGDVPPVVLDVLGSGGQALDGPIQRTLEERMDADFSSVRVHTGAQAAQAAEAIDAKAFTCGNDVVFNAGEYDPESPEGQYLLAHELAHVRQQTGAAISMMPQEGADLEIDPDPQLEREADEVATEALAGEEPLLVNRLGADVHIQRHIDQPRDSLGRFAEKDREVYEGKKYGRRKRPPYAPGQVDAVWQRADEEYDNLQRGVVLDPYEEDRVLFWDGGNRRGIWEMGHKPGREYTYLVEYYLRETITEDEFVREYQNPEHYHPQHPDTNRSGRYEEEGEYWVMKWGSLEEKA